MADYEERLITVLLEKTNLGSWELVESFLDADVGLTAQQALELGFVDDIIDA
jgi:ATP-dependent protease ClpP protease subunit